MARLGGEALPQIQCAKSFHGLGLYLLLTALGAAGADYICSVSEEGVCLSETEGEQGCVAGKRQRRNRTWAYIWGDSLGMTSLPSAQSQPVLSVHRISPFNSSLSSLLGSTDSEQPTSTPDSPSSLRSAANNQPAYSGARGQSQPQRRKES